VNHAVIIFLKILTSNLHAVNEENQKHTSLGYVMFCIRCWI